MKTRILHTRMWEDTYFFNLNRLEKLAFIYLLTNDKVSLTGIYELPDQFIVFNLGATNDEVQQIKIKFQNDGKFVFKDGWVKIVNHDKYNSFSGSALDAREKEFKNVPKDMITPRDTPRVHPLNIYNNNQYSINNRVVKGKYSSLKDITEKDLLEISEKYKVSLGFVKLKLETLKNYCESKGRRYKNYKSALRNFVLGDIQKSIVDKQQRKGGFVSAKDN